MAMKFIDSLFDGNLICDQNLYYVIINVVVKVCWLLKHVCPLNTGSFIWMDIVYADSDIFVLLKSSNVPPIYLAQHAYCYAYFANCSQNYNTSDEGGFMTGYIY